MSSRYFVLIFFSLIISCTDKPINGNELSYMGFYSSPDEIILKLKGSKKGFQENFMLGLAYKRKKNYKKSILYFANSCFTSHRNFKFKLYPQPVYKYVDSFHFKSDLYDDAVYEIAHLFYLYSEHNYVLKFLDLVSDKQKGLYTDSRLLYSKSLVVLKKFNEALSNLEDLDCDEISTGLIVKIRIGSLLEKLEKYNDSMEIYLKVMERDETTWQAGIASIRASDILLKYNIELNDNEKFIIGKSLYYNKKYKEALSILEKVDISNYDNRDNLKKYLIKLYIRNKNKKSAESLLNNLKNKSQIYYELLKAEADELWRMRKKYKAIDIYKKIIKTDHEPIAKESLKRISSFMEDRRKQGFEKYLISYKNKYDDTASGYFLWLLGRNKIRDNDPKKAREYLEEFLGRFPDEKYSDRCRFWLYKLYFDEGYTENSERMFKELVVKNPESSYTWLLIKNLKNNYKTGSLHAKYISSKLNKENDDIIFYHTLLFIKNGNIKEKDKRLKQINIPIIKKYIKFEYSISGMDISSGYSDIFQSTEKYFKIGHYKGIKRELKTIPNHDDELLMDKYISLAHYGRKYNNYHLNVHNTHELFKLKSLKENISLMPERTAKMLYPLSFIDCVEQYSKRYNIDKYTIYSVIKAESLFNNNAVSSAGAVGLMQLMPPTARGIARDLKIKKYNLKAPCISIQFGTKYIAWLKKYFSGNFVDIIAGYNAGAGNVKKWKKKLNSENLDYFIEFIPFSETRYYILRINKFLMKYKLIYE